MVNCLLAVLPEERPFAVASFQMNVQISNYVRETIEIIITGGVTYLAFWCWVAVRCCFTFMVG